MIISFYTVQQEETRYFYYMGKEYGRMGWWKIGFICYVLSLVCIGVWGEMYRCGIYMYTTRDAFIYTLYSSFYVYTKRKNERESKVS